MTSSEVVHAVSHSPHGPWHLRDVALPRRGRHYWDGMATHNPTVHYDELRRQYVLFYIGTTFSFDLPRGGPLTNRSLYELAWNAKRIGVATSPSLYGPWRRLSAPIGPSERPPACLTSPLPPRPLELLSLIVERITDPRRG